MSDEPIQTIDQLKQYLVALHDKDSGHADFTKMRSDMVAYMLLKNLLAGCLIEDYTLTFADHKTKFDREHPNGVRVKP